MGHAVYEGQWKLVFDMTDRPAALYDLGYDLAELANRIKDPHQSERVNRMEQLCRDIRRSSRSTPPMP